MNAHILKTWPRFYQAVQDGKKSFEVRENDRDFQLGDKLILMEWDPSRKKFSGRMVLKTISYMMPLNEFLGKDGKNYVVLGLNDHSND